MSSTESLTHSGFDKVDLGHGGDFDCNGSDSGYTAPLTSWRRERAKLTKLVNLAVFSSTLPLQGQSNAANIVSIFKDAFFANFAILSSKCTSAHL